MNIVFMGTPEFSVPSLKALIENFNVTAVFTQTDKPKGRGKKLSFSPVKEEAIQFNIPVYQPVRLKTDLFLVEKLKELKPDFIVVVAYGQILSKEIIDIPTFGCLNLHASLLPKYRGAAPINWAVINGEKISGNTTMLIDIGLDTGDMLLSREVSISDDMTAGELHDLLMYDGSHLLLETINKLITGSIKKVKQNNSMSSYSPLLNREMAKLDWSKTNIELHNFVRGLNPWPMAHTKYDSISMKVIKTRLSSNSSSDIPGTILNVSPEGIEVSTGSGNLIIQMLQFPNGKPLLVREYIKGHEIICGKVFE
jgi:methionyl-tRNA formyltransferase